MDYLSPLDASFLELEDEDSHASLAIASVAVLDGPAPSHEELTAFIRGRLPLVPRYRQRMRRIPLDLGRPVWVDDPDFDLDFHLRRTALSAPGDDATLCRTVARVMSQRLDRDRPLWEDWVIEGLPHGRWALLSKVHHCMVDGISGNQLYRLVFDASPEPAEATADTWQPRPDPGTIDLTLDALGQLARTPVDQIRMLLRALREPNVLTRSLEDTLRGLTALARSFAPAAPSSLLGPIGAARRYAVSRAPIADLTTVAKAFRVTVNDVYLAAVTGAFRGLMVARGEDPTPGAVRTLVPVNVRVPRDETVLDNRVSMMLLDLPIERDSATERLTAVHERVAALRSSKESEAGATVVDLAAHEPFAPVSLGMRIAMRLPQRGFVTVTTNVPGPRERLYILGRPIREILPYVPIANRMRTGVSLFTYAGAAVFGVTADFAAVPEVDAFATAIVDELNVLVAAAPPPPPRATPRARKAAPRARRRGTPATAR